MLSKDTSVTYKALQILRIKIEDVLDDYDKDTTLPLQVNGPFTFTTDRNPGITEEDAILKLLLLVR